MSHGLTGLAQSRATLKNVAQVAGPFPQISRWYQNSAVGPSLEPLDRINPEEINSRLTHKFQFNVLTLFSWIFRLALRSTSAFWYVADLCSPLVNDFSLCDAFRVSVGRSRSPIWPQMLIFPQPKIASELSCSGFLDLREKSYSFD